MTPNQGQVVALKLKPYASKWDAEAEIWEIFEGVECTTYLGCADTLEEAEKVALYDKEDKKCW
ncbi:hypothetical protein [Ferribacterium limneticum]|uniref:hypothetical protein n=1 Tax=Ferribacterium limneticum TaxID=76259 RepID=UPI001CF9207C|nr:hypothetical protein [Ferribacterium limneticum]UCV26749.1 hypothetical protein KI617_10550 [Ferribacterium limneticum]UCV30666.1 hypothetical protein KI608_10550 [Ferribacterium limneticum]